MSRRGRSLRDLLLVTLWGAPLITPLLRWGATACTHDGHLHYHRVVAMMHAWREGLLFSRWLPDLAFGYGYPFFIYREPLPLYLTLWPHLLGLPLPAAINIFYLLSILASGWFTYLWVRDFFGSPAGIVSAVAYMAAPYQLIDALVRGNQVESLALALFPLILWSGRNFMLNGRVRWLFTATLGLAALALSHNISLLLFTPALVLYLLFTGWHAQQAWTQFLWRLFLVVGLGLGMTSFYTAPAVVEIDEVTLTLSTSNRNNDFHFNFAALSEILAPVTPEDPDLINPPLPIRLGWAPVALALLGLLSLIWNRRPEQQRHIAFMALGAAGYLFFALPLSERLWEALPLIEFVQFPWRFVGRAALPVAVMAGAPFASGLRPVRFDPRRAIPLAAALGLLLLEAVPLLYPTYCIEEPYPTIHDVHAYEQESGMVGVDPVGSYFPITVEERPQSSPLLEDYAAGRAPRRFDERALPAGADLLEASYDPLGVVAVVDSPEAFQARYLSFSFPGWTASVDGASVPVTPEDATGLITFPVPAGRHTLAVNWGLTPLRAFFAAISMVATLGVAFVTVMLARRSREQRELRQGAAPGHPAQNYMPARAFIVLGFMAFVMLGGKLLIADRLPTPLRRQAAPPVMYESDLAAGGLHLTGYNLRRASTPAGGQFDIDLVWQVQRTPAVALQSNVWLRDAAGLIWSDRETFRPRIYEDAPPTQQWQPGQWAWDSREVHVLSGAPPGRYEIVLTLFDLADLQPLTLVREDGAVGPTAVIGHMDVVRPEPPPTFRPQHILSRQMGDLRLLGFNQDRTEAAPGDPVLLTFFWEKTSGGTTPETAPASLELTLRDTEGEVRRAWRIPPVHVAYPPGEWQLGERLRGQHLQRVPASLESGVYHLWLDDVELSELRVRAPQRQFDEPAYEVTVDQTFEGLARLVGYSLESATPGTAAGAPPAALTLRLVWQGVREMETSYTVFVHLVSGSGQIVAQSDAEPAQWTRPTTGWAPGEYVVDEHVLTLPAQVAADELALHVGLFDPQSGARLLLLDGADAVLLQP